MILRGRRGASLVELVVVFALMAIVAGLAIPRGWGLVHERRLRGAALYLRSLVRQVRSEAAAKGRYVGIVFQETDDEPELSLYIDGNGNGIRRADIRSGTDRRLRGPWSLSDLFPGVRYGGPSVGEEPPQFPPFRLGRGRMLSFSPIGRSSSGTLFLSNDHGLVYAVIVLGASGRVRLARYRNGVWEALS